MEKFRVFIKSYFVLRRYGTLLAVVLLLLSTCLIVVASYPSPFEKYPITSETFRKERSVKGSETQVSSNAKQLDHPRKNHHFRRRSTTMSSDSQRNGDSQEHPAGASSAIERLPPLLVNPGSPHDDVMEGKGKTEETKGNRPREESDHFGKVKSDSTEEEKARPIKQTSWENYTLCDGRTLLQNGAFCLEENHVFINGNEIWDGKLCRSLEEIFGWSSILEVSAGLGHYGRCFYRIDHNVIHVDNRPEAEYLESNYQHEMDAADLRIKTRVIKSWEGYDGSQNIELLSGGFVKEMDSTQPFDLKQMYDWVLSLGVGEHLPKEFLDTYLDNLTKHACKGIVLSWSAYVPESGVVTSEFASNDLVKRMRGRGLLHDRESQDFLRGSTRLLHLTDSVMVFRLPYEKQC